MFLGIVTLSKFTQPSKAYSGIFVTPFPIFTVFNASQFLKISFPMDVTLFGMVMLSNDLQP